MSSSSGTVTPLTGGSRKAGETRPLLTESVYHWRHRKTCPPVAARRVHVSVVPFADTPAPLVFDPPSDTGTVRGALDVPVDRDRLDLAEVLTKIAKRILS